MLCRRSNRRTRRPATCISSARRERERSAAADQGLRGFLAAHLASGAQVCGVRRDELVRGHILHGLGAAHGACARMRRARSVCCGRELALRRHPTPPRAAARGWSCSRSERPTCGGRLRKSWVAQFATSPAVRPPGVVLSLPAHSLRTPFNYPAAHMGAFALNGVSTQGPTEDEREWIDERRTCPTQTLLPPSSCFALSLMGWSCMVD
jgi:hypothetical protein